LNLHKNILKVKETYQLLPIASSGLTNFVYKSFNSNIAIIDSNGYIKGLHPGNFIFSIYDMLYLLY
jgi:hypothetical protein